MVAEFIAKGRFLRQVLAFSAHWGDLPGFICHKNRPLGKLLLEELVLVTADTLKRGLHKGVSTLWELSKVVVPVYIAVTFLKYTPALDWIARVCEPLMKYVGLPGEASLALVLGKLINIYAALGAITSLDLSSREITIIAAMLLLSHSLPMEGAVAQKTGVSGVFMTVVRISISIIAGLAMNMII